MDTPVMDLFGAVAVDHQACEEYTDSLLAEIDRLRRDNALLRALLDASS